jgi:hypothetical protein
MSLVAAMPKHGCPVGQSPALRCLFGVADSQDRQTPTGSLAAIFYIVVMGI